MAAFHHWEISILDQIAELFHSPGLDKAMPFISSLGDHGWLWIALTLLLLFNRSTRQIGLTMGVALVFSLFWANLFLKPLLARTRPFDLNTAIQLLISAPTDFSFPSGHSQASFAAATAIFFYRKRPGIAALLLAALIAFSRLYLYVHFPSDVLAGSMFGVILALSAHYLVEKYLTPMLPDGWKSR